GKYYSGINQPDIMYELNKIIYDSNLIIPNISFSNPEKLKLEDDKEVDSIAISLPFKGTYKDLNGFLVKLKENPKKLLVSQLSISRDFGDMLDGHLTLTAFSEGDASDSEGTFYYNNENEPVHTDNPFASFLGEDEYYDILEEEEDTEKRKVIDDLETGKVFFMGTSPEVTGNISKINKAKNGKSSIRFEYFISTNFKEERAFVVLDDRNISFKYPPEALGLWVFSYGYSPVTVGLRFQDLDGRKYNLDIARGIDWLGWKYISSSPIKDLKIYPLKLDRIYVQLEANRDEYGVFLFDGIEASYAKKGEKEEDEELPNYELYMVKPGDTLKSISKSFYGSESKYKKIAENNGIDANMDLAIGTVLVIEK
ncbi:MAG: LysM peptidoglycan-binding domain-containing protein, partial [Clostridiales bacterium]|nr:LysM peptidoglycan-binding domain-containing protein [Clostridiales bacterium]